MKRDKMEIMLGELGKATEEDVGAKLGERVKAEIPGDLHPHRGGMDSMNIIIDLRVSRVAAAAVIVGATVLFATLFGSRDPDSGLYRDSKAIITYLSQASEPSIGAVVLYGESRGHDGNDLLMHWKVSQNEYEVMFLDRHTETVNSEELIRLQAEMIQRITEN